MVAILGFSRGGESIRKEGIFVKQRNDDGVESGPVVCPERSRVAASDVGDAPPPGILIPGVAWGREGHYVGDREMGRMRGGN